MNRDWLSKLVDRTKATAFTPTDYARILLIGEYGVGKTRFCGIPGAFFLDFDDGMTTLLDKQGNPPPHVPFRKGDNSVYENVMSILEDLRSKSGPFAKDQKLGSTRLLVIDGVTMMAKVFLEEICQTALKPGQDIADFKPTYDEWGLLVRRMETVISTAKTVPYHLIVTARVKSEVDELTKQLVGSIDILGSYRNQIGYEFNEVYLVEKRLARPNETKETNSKIANDFITAFHPRFKVKSRLQNFAKIPDKIPNPTWDTLVKPFYKKRGGWENA